MKSQKPIIGIDLGTTLTVISRIDPSTGRPEIIRDPDGLMEIPSAVWLKNGEIVVGAKALRSAPLYPDKVYYRIKPEADDEKYQLQGITFEDYFAHILKYGKLIAANVLKSEIADAVITRPAYFHHLGNERLLEAAKIAGINALKVVAEPVAAATAFMLENPQTNGLAIVVDFGGGTLDICVVELGKSNDPDIAGQVKANYGDLHLGGRDFDNVILQFWVEQWQKRYGNDPLTNPRVKADWLERAERCKKDLSSDVEVEEHLAADGKILNPKLTRDHFEDLIADQVETFRNCLRETLKRAQIDAKDINHIIPVGGSMRIPRF